MAGDNPFMNWDIPMTNQRIYKYAMVMGGGDDDLNSYVGIKWFKTLKEGIQDFFEIWHDYEWMMEDLENWIEIDIYLGDMVSFDGLTLTGYGGYDDGLGLPKRMIDNLKEILLQTPPYNPAVYGLFDNEGKYWKDYEQQWKDKVESLNLSEYERTLDKAYTGISPGKVHLPYYNAWAGIIELKKQDEGSGSTWRLVRIP